MTVYSVGDVVSKLNGERIALQIGQRKHRRKRQYGKIISIDGELSHQRHLTICFRNVGIHDSFP